MMYKAISVFLIASFLIACSGEPKQDSNIEAQKSTATVKKDKEESKPEFPEFETVVEALKSAGDYREKDGNLKVLSSEGEPLHIQVSKWIFEGDPEETIKKQVKRNIVYVAFQAFAETEINELTITSIPQKFEDKGEYVDRYKKTVTVNRETATQILKEQLNTASFKDLYELDNSGQIWLPNDNFNKLKFDKLNAVYSDLAK